MAEASTSGLSALIEAATSQLSDLASTVPNHDPEDIPERAQTDDGGSSDGGEDKPQSRTPTMVPESADPRKHSFPELLMTLASDPTNKNTITFLPDGKFFAIRAKDFTEEVMGNYFAVSSFEEFIELANDWGFRQVLSNNNNNDIEVLHHPHFVQGDWERCTKIKFGESPEHARLHALPQRTRFDFTAMEESVGSIKRRLSPGHLSRRASETSISSQKMKFGLDGELETPPGLVKCRSDSAGAESHNSPANSHSEVDNRSIALSIATEKLQLKDESTATALVDQAVDSATKSIVVDAIETLLKDQSHTKKIYLKHEEELSKSSLPGVVPISKQLFCDKKEEASPPPAEVKVRAESPAVEGGQASSLEGSPRSRGTPGDE